MTEGRISGLGLCAFFQTLAGTFFALERARRGDGSFVLLNRIMDDLMEKEGECIRMMNNRGRGSGLMLIIVLLVALLIAWFAVTQMGGFGFGKTDAQQEQAQQNAIEQAQNAVDAINNRMQQSGLEP